MKHALILSLIFLSLCNSCSKISAADIKTYITLAVIPIKDLEEIKAQLSEVRLIPELTTTLPKATLIKQNGRNNTWSIIPLITNSHEFNLEIDRVQIGLLRFDLRTRMIIAAEEFNLGHHLYITVKDIVDIIPS